MKIFGKTIFKPKRKQQTLEQTLKKITKPKKWYEVTFMYKAFDGELEQKAIQVKATSRSNAIDKVKFLLEDSYISGNAKEMGS